MQKIAENFCTNYQRDGSLGLLSFPHTLITVTFMGLIRVRLLNWKIPGVGQK